MSTTGTTWGSSDHELEQLAAEPARPLFPLLNHAEAMLPFVVVLAFLPALYAVANRTLSEPGAWQGVAAMKCLAVGDPLELFDPLAPHQSSVLSDAQSQKPYLQLGQQFRFQPPLMIWLTALAMQGFGIGTVAGLVGAAYFCTAGLLVASYILARRLGGEQLGLMTVVLLAFNPQILQGAQEPVPQSAAILFALLALTGILVHWQKSSAFVSYPLLLSGLALGTCLLAGGPVALAILLIVLVYVLFWKLEAWQHDRTGVVWDRSQFSRRTALRSVLVLAVTAFAFGSWTVLLPASHYGGEFWSEWLAGPGIAAVASAPGPAPSWGSASIWELNRLAVPVFALSLLGMAVVVRDWWRAHEDPAKRHRGILLVWIAIALVAWMLQGGPASHGAPVINVWETLLTVPLAIAAALGLIEIAERRIGFLWSLSIGVLSLADAAVCGRQSFGSDQATSLSASLLSERDWGLGIVALLTLIAIGTALALFTGPRETRLGEQRRRAVLCGLLVTTILVNCAWGAMAIRRTNPADRELDDLRSGLSRLTHVDRCTFVALAPPGRATSLQPPAQIIYALASLWPQSSMDFAGSWESAMRPTPSDAAASNPKESGTAVFIAWSPRGRLRGTAPDTIFKTAAAPFFYRGMEFVAYIREQNPPPRADDGSENRSSLE